MSSPTHAPRRSIRAAIIGLGLDGGPGPRRILNGSQCFVVGGSPETHAAMVETMLRLESELERRGRTLGDVSPDELLDIAARIDSPELLDIALRMESGLEAHGVPFEELTAEELTALTLVRPRD
jgi:hypothetical protein